MQQADTSPPLYSQASTSDVNESLPRLDSRGLRKCPKLELYIDKTYSSLGSPVAQLLQACPGLRVVNIHIGEEDLLKTRGNGQRFIGPITPLSVKEIVQEKDLEAVIDSAPLAQINIIFHIFLPGVLETKVKLGSWLEREFKKRNIAWTISNA